MARRSGITLVEVLVAIFVMGIGMIALLTLFPIGVLRMAQAINAERAAQAACIAHENAIAYNFRNDSAVVSDAKVADYFANPLPGKLTNADPYGESYTLFVDPIGFVSAPSVWVGGYTGVLRRQTVSLANTQANLYRYFSLWDDMTYNKIYDPTTVPLTLPGTPELAGTLVMRDTRYSWGYTMRRPVTAKKSVVDCSIVVFDSRSLSLGANLNLGEHVYSAFFNPNNNTVIVGFNAATNNPPPPPIRPGNWIMDATIYQTHNGGSQHNYWYRVLATQDVVAGGNTYAVFEVQGQVRGFNNYPIPEVADPTLPGSTAYPHCTIVILDGVAEVFEKGPVRAP